MNDPKNNKQIKLHFPKDTQAVYANIAIISSTKNEIILDFAQMLPPDPRARVQSRVVMSPAHAKMLLNSLQRNIERYEAQHGEIEVNVPPSLAEQLFKGVQSDDDNGDDDNDES
jgi:hypothetical protein